MGRADYHYIVWPKVYIPNPGPFSVSIFEGGDPGNIVCRLVYVTPSDHQRMLTSSTTDAGIHLDFPQCDCVNLVKTGALTPKP